MNICRVQEDMVAFDATVHWQVSFPNFLSVHVYVTDITFKSMIKCHYRPTPATDFQNQDIAPLDYNEENALRYAAGYVPRALRKRLERGFHPLKEELVLCLVELCEDDGTDVDASADWSMAISRGGIKLVNNKTYHFFHAVG